MGRVSLSVLISSQCIAKNNMVSFWVACICMMGSMVLDQWVYFYIPLITKLFQRLYVFHV